MQLDLKQPAIDVTDGIISAQLVPVAPDLSQGDAQDAPTHLSAGLLLELPELLQPPQPWDTL